MISQIMNKTRYYYEYLDNEHDDASFFAESDEAALERVKDFHGRLLLYKERRNMSGLQFIQLREDK